MRDFSPKELQQRREILAVIQKTFENFGFQPIETPSMETTETLLGKYGEEGDRLIFKILNSGDFMKAVDESDCIQKDAAQIAPKITEKALRYDLTVPFARYVVQHRNEINLPFKRYQIQPVWRADRPQKGRYREFYQCDADVVGSDALWSEVEFLQLYDTVFHKLNLPDVSIKINHRKILSGLAEVFEISERIIDFTVALDKLDKIGKEGVIDEIKSRYFPQEAIAKIKDLLNVDFTDNQSVIAYLKEIFVNNETGQIGVEELEFVLKQTQSLGLNISTLMVDLTLARGINYYTGTIIEVLPPQSIQLGSIGGGGRYDDLTGIFGMPGLSGVGISFGLDRIYLVMESLGLFKEQQNTHQVLFINFGEREALYAQNIIKTLRNHDIAVRFYPDADKLKKQFAYADKEGFRFVLLAGASEIDAQKVQLKNLDNGTQESFDVDELAQHLIALTATNAH